MASTYSSLKIQLMATGENSGTWGSVTNTNLGTAIEEAIVGSADVTFNNADVTLTLTDTNASQSARNLRLNLTGTVTVAQSLIVPAIEKVYIINNGLSQTITVKVSGQTGIAVPAGKTMYVYNNATDCVDAITHLTSLTLATALPVASGGTGSTTATFSGANITSLNADSISSGTLSNSRLGTVGVANGGTNVTTLTANNVILGNGTAGVLFVAPGTSSNVLTSNGTTWVSQAVGGGFDAGTRMIFAQNTAPTGWTKDASNYNNHALRIVTGTGGGTGGSVDFTTAFASQTPSGSVSVSGGSVGNTTLSTPVIPSHTHTVVAQSYAPPGNTGGAAGTSTTPTGATGGGGAHNHPFTGQTATFSGNAINLAVKYLDVITATKN